MVCPVDYLGCFFFSELRQVSHIGAEVQDVIVPGDKYPVGGHHEIRFDKIRTLCDGQFVRCEGMLGSIAGGTPMGDYHGSLAGQRFCVGHSAEYTIVAVKLDPGELDTRLQARQSAWHRLRTVYKLVGGKIATELTPRSVRSLYNIRRKAKR